MMPDAERMRESTKIGETTTLKIANALLIANDFGTISQCNHKGRHKNGLPTPQPNLEHSRAQNTGEVINERVTNQQGCNKSSAFVENEGINAFGVAFLFDECLELEVIERGNGSFRTREKSG